MSAASDRRTVDVENLLGFNLTAEQRSYVEGRPDSETPVIVARYLKLVMTPEERSGVGLSREPTSAERRGG